MDRIARFEALARQLVEGTFLRLFNDHLHPIEVAVHLACAMEDGRVVDSQGVVMAPERYLVYLHPDDYQALHDASHLLEAELAAYVARLAWQGGYLLSSKPVVTLHPAPTVPLRRVQVKVGARHASPVQTGPPADDDTTSELPVSALRDAALAKARQWSLSANGRMIPLGEPVVRLGRGLDNDVIIEDTLASRYHAELRWRHNGYVLRDLGSSQGTTVNDIPVVEQPLRDGDVIGVAGVKLVVEVQGESPFEP
jgi:hypothetical protein